MNAVTAAEKRPAYETLSALTAKGTAAKTTNKDQESVDIFLPPFAQFIIVFFDLGDACLPRISSSRYGLLGLFIEELCSLSLFKYCAEIIAHLCQPSCSSIHKRRGRWFL